MLKKRFGDSEEIKRSYYRRLADISPCGDNYHDMMRFLNELEAIYRSLTAIGCHISGEQFSQIAFDRLPNEVCTFVKLSKKTPGAWTPEALLETLETVVAARKRDSEQLGSFDKNSMEMEESKPATGEALVSSRRFKMPGPSAQARPNYPNNRNRQFPNTAIEFTNSRFSQHKPPYAKNNPRSPTCSFCNRNDHYTAECNRFTTVDSRSNHARQMQLCFNCLGSNHVVRECKSTKSCRNCGRSGHNTALCRQATEIGRPKATWQQNFRPETRRAFMAESQTDDYTGKTAVQGSSSSVPDDLNLATEHADVKLTSVSLKTDSNSKVTLLQSAEAPLFSGSKQSKVRMLLDSCSDHTYVTQRVARHLNLKMTQGPPLEIHVFGNSNPVKIPTKVSEVHLQFRDGTSAQLEVYVIPYITTKYRRHGIDCTKLREFSKRYALADRLPEHPEDIEVDVLVGNDYFSEIVFGSRQRVDDGLFLIQSRLGWIVSGKAPIGKSSTTSSSALSGFTLVSASGMQFEPDDFEIEVTPYLKTPPISDLWSLDTLGIKEKSTSKDEDAKALQQFQETIRLENGRYTARFPWIEEKAAMLPDNYQTALKRLKSLTKRLQDKPELLNKYDNIIQEQLRTGITEIVNTEHEPEGVVNYLPHREVEKPDKETTKVRIVYDASSRQTKTSVSLNDCLRRGPVFLENLSGMLMRFQLHRIALVADIKKAFHQVALDKKDRDATRFLWLRNPTATATLDNILVLRFQRVLFGAKPSPMLLEATVDHHLTTKGSPVCEQINGNIYMDNLVTGVETVEEAEAFYTETKEVFQEVGMNMREWTSNSKEFLSAVPEKDQCKPKMVKVLGIKWDTTADVLKFDVPEKTLKPVATKRDLVSAVSAVFDPNGIVLPLSLKGKVLLQKVDQKTHGWDTPVTRQTLEEWKQYIEQLKLMNSLRIPRYTKLAYEEGSTYHLHCFTDASDKCYATSIYLRIQRCNDTVTRLIFAKGRVNPMKKLTIPRLELMGVLIGVRALNFVEKELRIPIAEKYLWTDSTCVLQWLRSTRNLGKFVNNRIAEIRLSSNVNYRHVRSKENPADIPTRSTEFDTVSKMWFGGPEWLQQPPEDWPNIEIPPTREPVGNTESATIMTTASQKITTTSKPPFGINCEKYSRLNDLLCITAWCNRFVKKIRRDVQSENKQWITAPELKVALMMWVKHEQDVYIEASEKKHKSYTTLLRNLGVFKDNDGIIRCKGRFGCSTLCYTTRYPALLPKTSHITKLIIEKNHKETMHGGVAHTLARVRTQFWIIGGRNTVRNTIYKCPICRRQEGPPYRMKQMPDLPGERVIPGTAFQAVGLDYFGPMFVKAETSREKVWCVIFVCLKVRAVHLEMVEDISTSGFLMALRRFISRYGTPQMVISDHGSQFELADTILQKLWTAVERNNDVATYCANQGITWKKIVEYAPWQGGTYERLVQTVKRPLRKVLQRQVLTSDQLRTLLYEVAAVVNTRPLIAKPALDDTLSVSDILTPAHFLLPNPRSCLPVEQDTTYSKPLHNYIVQSYKETTRLLNAYWQDWTSLYLTSLREQHKKDHLQSRGAISRDPIVGEAVIVRDASSKRSAWKLGRIHSLHKSSDGHIRSADVKTPSGKIVRRAINHLYPLEGSARNILHNATKDKETTVSTNTHKDPKDHNLPR